MRPGVVFLVLCAGCAGDDDEPTGPTNTVTVGGDYDVVWTDLVRLEVEVDSGLVALGSFDSPDTSIRAGGADDGETFGSSEEAGVGSVWSICSDGVRGCGMGFDIVVPHALPVIVSSFEGPVDVIGHEGTLNVISNSGPVTVTERPTGPLTITTQSGPVVVVYAEEPTNVSITTQSGDIGVTLPGEDYILQVSSDLGTVDLQGVRNAPGNPRIELSSVSGNITVVGTGI